MPTDTMQLHNSQIFREISMKCSPSSCLLYTELLHLIVTTTTSSISVTVIRAGQPVYMSLRTRAALRHVITGKHGSHTFCDITPLQLAPEFKLLFPNGAVPSASGGPFSATVSKHILQSAAGRLILYPSGYATRLAAAYHDVHLLSSFPV